MDQSLVNFLINFNSILDLYALLKKIFKPKKNQKNRGFSNQQAMTPFLKTIKYLSITFYLYLSYVFLPREKKLIDLNNLIIAEI